MIEPTFEREEQLLSGGARSVAGVDEAGRGPLAGPVVAAAVLVAESLPDHIADLVVRDSKTMTERQRNQAFDVLTGTYGVAHGIGVVDNDSIDEIGILPATMGAMHDAVRSLADEPGHLLVDGRSVLQDLALPQTAAPRLDGESWVCAAASVIAKVTRDRIMQEYHALYPLYGFDRHKGYGTQKHRKALQEHGACPIHRRSFTLL